MLIGLGFSPLAASGLSLIANTAPVAFGALGTPIITLAEVTGLDLMELSAMVGRQLPFFSVIVPFWLIWAFAGWRGMLEIWPAILVAGVSLRRPAVPGVELPRAVAGGRGRRAGFDGGLTLFLRVWKPRAVALARPRQAMRSTGAKADGEQVVQTASTSAGAAQYHAGRVIGLDAVDDPDGLRLRLGHARRSRRSSTASGCSRLPVAGLHNLVEKVPPVVAERPGRRRGLQAQPAVGDRHRHPAGGDRRRLAAGLLARSA